MTAPFDASGQCFLPLLVDPTATDRDEDAISSPLVKTKPSAAVRSKLRDRSGYAMSLAPRWKTRRRPRALSSSTRGSTRPECRPSLLDKPLPVDVAAVIMACTDLSIMGVAPAPLAPLDYRLSSPTDTSRSSPTRPETVSPIAARLPPLELSVLQRPRLFLPTDGFTCSSALVSSGSASSIGVEEIVRIQEHSPAKLPPRSRIDAALRLTIVPKKCVSEDEVALMPCHSLGHRGFPELAAELWREPLRDRNKHWQQDELALTLASTDTFAARRRRGLGMTVAPSPANRGKWRRWEAQKLHFKPSSSTDGANESPLSSAARRRQQQSSQPDGMLLRNFGAMISKTYCLVSIYGVGLVGRLYDAGVSQREQLSAEFINATITSANGDESAGQEAASALQTSAPLQQQRYLRLEAYDLSTSRVFSLRITLGDLAWAFHERPAFLVAGRKLALLRELVALLYFEYPGEDDDGGQVVSASDAPTSHHDGPVARQEQQQGPASTPEPEQGRDRINTKRNVTLPVLRLARERRLSEAARRRMEREARLRWEEQQRLLALSAFLKLPRRARHRLACKCVKLSGRTFVVSVYHLPAQVRSFVAIAYHPRSSTSYHLTVGVSEVATLSRVLSLPHTWSTDQRRSLAESVVPRLRFCGSRIPSLSVTGGSSSREEGGYDDYRAALAIQEDRPGPWAAPGWLPPLERLHTHETIRAELTEKRQRDLRCALELTASKECDHIRQHAEQRGSALEKQLFDMETRRASLLERDAELVKQIEEINSRGSAASGSVDAQSSDPSGNTTSKVHHELRRAHKAARKALKAELKALNMQTADRKRELQLLREQAQLDLVKQQRRLKRKLQALSEQNAAANPKRTHRSSDADSSDGGDNGQPSCSRFWQSRRDPKRGQRTWLARGLIRGGDATLVASGACRVESTRLRYSLFALGIDSQANDISSFRLELYENESNLSVGLEVSRLDWIVLTKATSHEQQLRVPELAIAASPAVQRVQELDSQLADLQRELAALASSLSALEQARNSRKSSTAATKAAAKRLEVAASFTALSRERRSYSRLAPWSAVVRGLCDRLRLVRSPTRAVVERIEIDRCLFRATLPIISLTDAEDDGDTAEEGPSGDSEPFAPVMTAIARRSSTSGGADDGHVVYCHVRALLSHEELHFEVFEPLGRQTWRLKYPDSLELVKEFAGNTFMEQQLHVEAIATTMVFFVSPRSGRAELRFEE